MNYKDEAFEAYKRNPSNLKNILANTERGAANYSTKKTWRLNTDRMQQSLIDFTCGAVVGILLASLLFFNL